MKRILSIATVAIFVLGLAATAFAIHAEIPAETQAAVAKGTTQLTLGGSIRVRGDYRQNMDFNDDDTTGNKAAWDQRTRLSTDVKTSDMVEGRVMIEAASGNTNDVYTWGTGGDGASGIYPVGNAKRGELNLLEAWIQYTPELVGVKIGHMPLALGNKLFFDHTKFGDDALVLFKSVGDVHVAALTAKFDENNNANADDADAYVALFSYKGEPVNLSGDITLVNDNQTPANSLALYNIGLRGDIGVAAVKIYADVEFQTGTIQDAGFDSLGNPTDVDFKGYAAQLGASTKLNGLGLGLELGMGSGQELDSTTGAPTSPNDFEIFVTSLSPGIPYITYVHGTRAGDATGGANGGGGISNLTYVKASVDSAITDSLTGKVDLAWLKATEKIMSAAGTQEDDLGIEIDAFLKYKLARGLVYFVEAGYLMAGDAYQYLGPTGAVVDPDDAYAIRHGIELTF